LLTANETRVPSIATTFGEHHRRLTKLFTEVTEALRVGDGATARQYWGTLDRELNGHMALEEREMLPRFAEVDPDATATLRADHVEFRRVLDELGAALDLKRVTAPVAEAFFERLNAHATQEDALLYRWADRTLPSKDHLLGKLRRTVGR